MAAPSLSENKMGIKPIGPLLAEMAIPMMISMLVQAFYNIVDSVYVSQISENALTAVSMAFPLQNLMVAFGAGTGVGMNALLSRHLGSGEPEKVTKIASASVVLYILTYLVFAVGSFLGTGAFYRAQTDNAEIIAYGTDYAKICLGFSFGLFSEFLFERMLQSTGKTKLSMVTQLVGAVINIIWDPILIFGLLGFPKMGVTGAAIATVGGQICSAITGFILHLKHNPEVKVQRKLIRWDWRIIREVYSIGIPSIVMVAISSVMTFGINKIIMGFTTTAGAVFGAYVKLQGFVFMPIFGLNNGMVPIISYNYGAKKVPRVKKTIIYTLIAATLLLGIGAACFELFPAALLKLFNASEYMLEVGIPALRIIAPHFLFAGVGIISSSVCQSIGKPIYALICSFCRQIILLLPIAWLLSKTGDLNMVWLAFPIAEFLATILSVIFLCSSWRLAKKTMCLPANC